LRSPVDARRLQARAEPDYRFYLLYDKIYREDILRHALRAERPNHVWSYDFVEDRTHEGRKYRMLNLIDVFTHECLEPFHDWRG
jgi:hypothetical protein